MVIVADSENIAGELMKEFKILRQSPVDFVDNIRTIDSKRGENLSRNQERGLMLITLVTRENFTTECINDVDGRDAVT